MLKHFLSYLFGVLGGVLLTSSVLGFSPEPSLAGVKGYDAASGAVLDALPQVAADGFRVLLNSDQEWTEQQRVHLTEALIESEVRSGRGEAALQVIAEASKEIQAGAQFWKGQALAASGRFREAIVQLEKVAEAPEHPMRFEAGLTVASLYDSLGQRGKSMDALRGLAVGGSGELSSVARLRLVELLIDEGKLEEAKKLLSELKDGSSRPDQAVAREYLKGRVALKEGNTEAAVAITTAVLEGGAEMSHRLHDFIRLALADAHLAGGQREEAESWYLTLASEGSDERLLDLVFHRLYDGEFLSSPDTQEKLAGWIKEAANDRAVLASYYGALEKDRTGKPEAALEQLGVIIEQYPSHFLNRRWLVKVSEILFRLGRGDEALEKLKRLTEEPVLSDELRAQSQFMLGRGEFRSGNLDAAAKAFQAAAQGTLNQDSKTSALLNAAMAVVAAGESAVDSNVIASLEEVIPLHQVRIAQSEAQLEGALFAAANGNPEAANLLAAFEAELPDHPRMGEAKLAQAELAILAEKPDLATAKKIANEALKGASSEDIRRRAGYIVVWTEMEAGDLDVARNSLSQFAAQWPDAPQLAELRMKLGQRFYVTEDFPNAQRQFEILASESPESHLVEPALFFAGKSAMSLLSEAGVNRALNLWSEVAEGDGELALHARYYQAEAKRRLGNSEEAISLLEGVLENDPEPPRELKWESLVARAEILLQKGNEDDIAMSDAQTSLSGIVNGAANGVDPVWFQRATYQLMQAFDVAEKPEESIAAGYAAVVAGADSEPDPTTLFWLYRNGFKTITDLGGQGKWEAAVNVADRLSKLPGDRAREAHLLAEKMRLEHFIWADEAAELE